MNEPSPIHALIFAFIAGIVWYLKRRYLLPLAFKKQPAHGNMKPWEAYAHGAPMFEPLMMVSTFPRMIMVVNTANAAFELFEKRPSFANRVRWPMAELLGRQDNVGFAYYGNRLKKMRRVLHGSLGPNVVDTVWGELADSMSKKALEGFLNMERSDGKVYGFVQGIVEEFIVRLAYGRAPDANYSALSRRVIHETGVALQPGRWLVNLVPALMYVPAWVPGADFQRWAADAREAFYTLTRVPFKRVESDIATGEAQASFVQHALENSSASSEDEDIIMCVAGSLYSAGNDTLSNVILTFLLLMVHHPDVQEHAHEEIQRVCGRKDGAFISGAVPLERLPELSDRSSLPYIDAVIQELHRFNPSIPLLTRSNAKQEEYEQYKIPRGTWTMANLWGILHDEREYPSPKLFDPRRFVSMAGTPVARDPRTLVYGFGRRMCPGMHLANNFIFLVIARTFATFKIQPDPSAGTPPIEFETGLVPVPKEFKCCLNWRDNARALLATFQE